MTLNATFHQPSLSYRLVYMLSAEAHQHHTFEVLFLNTLLFTLVIKNASLG